MAIIVNMACGLANRMFQYSFYRYLLHKGYDAKVDYFTTKTLAHEKVEWSRIFPDAAFDKASAAEILKLGGGKDIFSKIFRKYLNRFTKVSEMSSAYSVYKPEKDNENRYILGVFQNAVVVESIEEELREAFQFKPFQDEQNIKLASKLQKENSVAIHVRKGNDYQSRIWYKNTCSSDYYKTAIDLIKKSVENPVFYVFTDNPEWVKDNISGFDYTIISHNPVAGWGSHFDLHLMSLCKHNIISNSTYSWWGAFLNSNPDKTVIIPEIWFNPEATHDFSSVPLKCKGWIAL